jgi:CRP-like cAMP-binding protein
MAKIDVKKLKFDAEKYRGKGKLDKAIELYQQIEQAKAADAKTLQKMAEIYIKTDDEDKGIETYKKAMTSYLETGFLIQAIAVGKIIQELCPDDDQITKEVESLLAKKMGPAAAKLQPKKVPAQPLKPVEEEAPEPEPEAPAEQESAPEPEPAPDGEEAPRNEADQAIPLGDTEAESAGEMEASGEAPAEEEPETATEFHLFSDLNPEEFTQIYEKLRSVKIPRGVRICRDGESGDSIFIIAQGEAEVTKKNQLGEERLLGRLGPGSFFGEFGYFTDGNRHATVEAVTDLELLEIEKAEIDLIIQKYPQVKEVMYRFYKERVLDNLLVMSPLTALLSVEDRQKLISKFQFQEFKQGETIVKEGEPGDAMFLIKSGRAEVTTIDPKDHRKLTLARLGAGEFFGEVSLIKNKPRTATITALIPVELLVINRQSLDELTNEHPEMVSLLEQTIEKRVEDTIKKIIGDKK